MLNTYAWQTSPPSAQEATMKLFLNTLKVSWNSLEIPLKHSGNTLATSLKIPWNTIETFLKHPENALKTPLKLPWNTLETSLKHPWNFLKTLLKLSWNTLKTSLERPWNLHETPYHSYDYKKLLGDGRTDGISDTVTSWAAHRS